MKRPYETTWVDLANRALARLNQNFIKDFSEGTNSSLMAEQALSSATGEILSYTDWRSAVRSTWLHPAREMTVDGLYTYPFPADFIRLVKVDSEDWERRGHALVSRTGTDLLVQYVAFPETPGTLDPLLLSAISLMAAYKMALTLTADTVLQSQLFAEMTTAVTTARLNETQAEPDEMYSTNDWKENY